MAGIYIRRINIDKMKLNSKSRYAVMALADMATLPAREPVSLRDISLRPSISLTYCEQIIFSLKTNNIGNSIMGTNGGYNCLF